MDFLTVILYILATYPIVIMVFGSLTSILNIIVCLRKRLRRVNTFIVLAFISFADIFTLFDWNFLRFYSWYFPGLPYESSSLMFCKIITYTQFVSLEWSSWLLVSFDFVGLVFIIKCNVSIISLFKGPLEY